MKKYSVTFTTYEEYEVEAENETEALRIAEEKLESDKKTLTEYLDFVKDANSSFKDLYVTLEQKISELDSAISSNKAAYNKGKYFWEKIW